MGYGGYGALRHLSVFSYFNAADILHTGSLNMVYLVICAVAAVGALIGTYVVYRRHDLIA